MKDIAKGQILPLQQYLTCHTTPMKSIRHCGIFQCRTPLWLHRHLVPPYLSKHKHYHHTQCVGVSDKHWYGYNA
ncbi:uncharacterized protein A1O5_08257 [Cladophialophora psammophila CBS 110553]|uniref:Uncharacterized protein n=1 Tax=Cladophialophora psammophila CBS 110553 TaxID=1182543 RepID=W9XDH1_9EURO|nr:uncharacterized protein A1O5_08257 [Cladophialophora psammophila CBS 110553]EXJ68464.1 hypothetical protein A1O5_08257 [Cladophialophora psammophila CBS 110553]